MRIFILDDCEILRLSLSMVFQQSKGLTVVGLSDSKGDVFQKILSSGCETLLLGLRLQNYDGLQIARRLRAMDSDLCIIVLGDTTEASNVQEMYQSGADSFISMSTNNQEMIERILVSRRNKAICDFSIIASSDRLPLIPPQPSR